jgi:hypothetical protein
MLYLPSIMTNSKCLAALSFEASISPQMFLQLLSQCQICSSRESALLIQQRYHTQRSLQGCAHKLSLSELLLSQPNSIMWSMHILAKDGGKPETWMDVCASIMEVHKCQQCRIIDLSRIYNDFSLSYNTFSMRSRHSWLSSKSTLVQSMFSDVYSCNTKTGLRTGIVQR